MRDLQKHTILDDDGAEQTYTLIPHSAQEGMKLAAELFAMLGPSAGKALDAAKGGVSGLLESDLSLGLLFGDLGQAMLANDCSDLMRRLLKNATRNGQQLDNPANFSMAFQGNYGELAEAAVWAVEVNGFLRFFVRLARCGMDAAKVG